MIPTESPVRLLVALTTVLLLPACAAEPVEPEPVPIDWATAVQGAEITLLRTSELDEVAILEDRRDLRGDRLIKLLEEGPPVVRVRAAVALGRFPFPEFGANVTRALCGRLEDPACRLEAAFALGLRADPTSAGVLAAYRNDPDPKMRARVIEAASKIDDEGLHGDCLLALKDTDLSVRIEAAVGAARWDRDAANAADVDRALLDTLRPYTIAPDRTARTAVEAELVWRILFALSRRQSEVGRGAFLEYADSDIPNERLFAVRGLAHLPPDAEVVDAAIGALKGDDWRAVYEATATLGKLKDPAALIPLTQVAQHTSTHVRAGAMAALGRLDAPAEKVLPVIRQGLADLSPTVANAALRAIAETVPASDAIGIIDHQRENDDPQRRAGAVEALSVLETEDAALASGIVARLREMTADTSIFVATRATEALGQHLTPDARLIVHDLLGHADNGIRLAAVMALRNDPHGSDAPKLMEASRTASGDISTEIAFNVLINLGQTPTEPNVKDFLTAELTDTRPIVRLTAARVLEEDFGVELSVTDVPPRAFATEVPLVGRGFPHYRTNPLIEIVTTRGSMVFELFPAETPVHVVNFMELAQRGAYNGLSFHRVVPDFVIQGGDYRGDGNGATPWQGEALRHEFTWRKYVRGSLGMPRNADVDSGGSQFFVTHRPTPHLDGKYTIFGELRGGGDVLDAIEQGDRIQSVRVLR